ncbi:hypothetical protein BH23THE1_BH23THE1_08510 [soil metagenome]
MSNIRIKKPMSLTFLSIIVTISILIIPSNFSYAYVEFDVSGIDSDGYSGEDRSISSSQNSLQGSYCYAPPNATIIDSCNSGDMSSSENTGLNVYN